MKIILEYYQRTIFKRDRIIKAILVAFYEFHFTFPYVLYDEKELECMVPVLKQPQGMIPGGF